MVAAVFPMLARQEVEAEAHRLETAGLDLRVETPADSDPASPTSTTSSGRSRPPPSRGRVTLSTRLLRRSYFFFLTLGGRVATYACALSTHPAACSAVQEEGSAR